MKVMWTIPQDAQKVFEWVLFDVYQKNTEQFDGSYKKFERVKAFNTAKALCVVDDMIVVLQESQPWQKQRLSLPWGILEKWEEPLVCITREITEETWYVFSSIQLLSAVSINVWLIDCTRYLYIAKNSIDKKSQNLDMWWEKIDVLYYDFDTFIEKIIHDETFLPWINEYIIRHYILPSKKDALHALLFS